MKFWGAPHVEELRTAGDVNGLINALRYKKDPYVRQAAAEALGQLSDERAVEPLLALLEDSRGRVRKAAVDALGEIGDTRAVQPLIASLRYTWEHTGVRIGTIEVLGKIGDEQAIVPLTALLKDRTDAIRVAAVEALGLLVRQADKRDPGLSERSDSMCAEIPQEKVHETSLALTWLMKSKVMSFVTHFVKRRGKMFFSRTPYKRLHQDQ